MNHLKIALAGNPNVGKSTVFNALTGLRQHTGNWPGKTVELKTGTFTHGEYAITLVDVPGTYSLDAHSAEEEVTRDYIASGDADGVVVVCDGCLLERNLILVLQIRAICRRVIVCVNLMDEAGKKGISVDFDRLSMLLGCPVIPCAARQSEGLEELTEAMTGLDTVPSVKECISCPGCSGCAACGDLSEKAKRIAAECVTFSGDPMKRDRLLDRIFTGKYTAYPVMGLLLALIFYITISGAGYLSDALSAGLEYINSGVCGWLTGLLPVWLVSLVCDGLIGTTFTVIAVMLPPMAIFFPLFTLLEDSGYLPRAAYNIDRCFKACGSCGKQSLTMMMGFGCNAAGVTGCRIIDSSRERLIAILTNSFVPCNGRFSVLLALVALFSVRFSAGGSALVMILIVVLCTAVTLAVSRLLSVTLLKGEPSSFTLELPPYRKPRVGQVLVRSLLDRTMFVLLRAVTAAAPAGVLIWLAANIEAGGENLLTHAAAFLDPIGRLAGMDGVMMCAFLCAFPAAEIMLPLAVMGYSGGGMALGEVSSMEEIFAANGWNDITVLCVIVFTLFHFPCSTTLITIRKETGSTKWTLFSAVLPTVIGYGGCVILNLIFS